VAQVAAASAGEDLPLVAPAAHTLATAAVHTQFVVEPAVDTAPALQHIPAVAQVAVHTPVADTALAVHTQLAAVTHTPAVDTADTAVDTESTHFRNLRTLLSHPLQSRWKDHQNDVTLMDNTASVADSNAVVVRVVRMHYQPTSYLLLL
jgi:hypothetical protein